MLINEKKVPFKCTRRKKAPELGEELNGYSISFSELLEELRLDPERYHELLMKILLDTETTHFAYLLPKEDLLYLKKLIYTLASLGFKYIDIEYLSLYALGAKRSAIWAKKYNNDKKIKIKDRIIGIYSTLITKKEFRKIHDEDIIKSYAAKIMDQKFVMFSFSSDEKIIITPIPLMDAKRENIPNPKK